MPAILARSDYSTPKEENKDKMDIIDVQPLPSNSHVTRKVSIPIDDDQASSFLFYTGSAPRTILESLHDEHKNFSPILCLALIYIFLAADANWFMMALFQIGLQALFFSKKLLQNPVARRILMLLSMSMMTSIIISLSLIRGMNDPTTHVAQQVFIYFFIIFSFIGFVFTNIYNICLLFAFGRSADWLIEVDSEEDREGGF